MQTFDSLEISPSHSLQFLTILTQVNARPSSIIRYSYPFCCNVIDVSFQIYIGLADRCANASTFKDVRAKIFYSIVFFLTSTVDR